MHPDFRQLPVPQLTSTQCSDIYTHTSLSVVLGPPTMRGAIVFSGSSHPTLVDGICDRLGSKRGSASLGKFANGETSVSIRRFLPWSVVAWLLTLVDTSIRDKDVFIVQSGSEK
jgi:ribose-phosphate pyrophosphokinase